MDIDSVLNQMRQEHSPTQEDRERVRTALSAALIVSGTAGAAHVATTAGLKSAAAQGTSTANATSVANGAAVVKGAAAANGAALVNGASVVKGAALVLPIWVKGAVGVGALVAAIGGGVYGVNAYRAAPARVAPSVSVPAQQVARDNAGDLARAVPAQAVVEEQPVVAPAPVADEDAPVVELRRTEAPKASRANVVAPAASSGATLTSLGELRLIGEASKALREGRTDEARSALTEHEKRYSNTALGQERSGLDLLARCAESNSDATRQAAEAFLRRSPKSPLAGSIRRECLE